MFELSPVTPAILRIPNNMRGKAKYNYSTFQVVRAHPEKQNKKYFVISDHYPEVELHASADQITALTKSLQGTKYGEGDYSIGTGRDNVLWFWWYPE